ncbi:hypothetical protein CHRY9393_01370 [Chryseobacterium fistulae]|uniref:Tc1-like transposase DDE domain-containing protein n=1 Tax=Chryseobacterium fistulae TaxID=2675058 RepID=A0A6N4XMF6_9FLAO|nr:hypothetical protein CHRY9393_01370 [Chryseobacterium fistulae]
MFHPKSDPVKRAEFEKQRIDYQNIEQRSIIYIDESGFATDAPRNNAYSFKGTRCYGRKDWHNKGRVNAIGAIMDFKMVNMGLFQGNINADVFHAWVTQELLFSIPEKAVIVMDNATFHKRADSIEAIESRGHTILFLPPSSPHLNPIEKKWAQAKSIRRKVRCDPYVLFQKFIK